MDWSQRELARLSVIERYSYGLISREEAAQTLRLSTKQISRLKRRLQEGGVDHFNHKGKGRRAFNRVDQVIENKVIEVFLDWRRNTDEGVNAPHLRDILLWDFGIEISRQKSWRLLKSQGLLINTRKVRKHRKKRDRRSLMGDLLYLDGSPHRWLGENEPKVTLVLLINA